MKESLYVKAGEVAVILRCEGKYTLAPVPYPSAAGRKQKSSRAKARHIKSLTCADI
jgi:hypothetical protein